MTIDIWSDFVCPFCYIGKRKLEAALAGFAHRDQVEIRWRSFELNPDLAPLPAETSHGALARVKSIPLAEAVGMADHVTRLAAQEGLRYDFHKAVAANSFAAHQLLHFGAAHGRQDALKERLFAAYYTEGEDINNVETLVRLAAEVSLDADAARQALRAGTYAGAVREDEREAQRLQIQGVPFFVFDEKYAVSGAQPSAVFADVLAQVWQESQPALVEGATCGPEGC